MEYTNKQLKRELDQAFKLLKNKHNIDISEEELLSNNTALSIDERIEILSMLISVAESEKKERITKKNEKTTITVDVLKETADLFNTIYEESGVTVGEQIDRMSLNFHPYNMELAAQLICEDILVHTVNFNDVQRDFVIYLVLSMLKKSFVDNEPNSLRRLVDEVSTLILSKDAEVSLDSEIK